MMAPLNTVDLNFAVIKSKYFHSPVFLLGPVQCFAGYFYIEYGHLLDGEKQMGVIIIILEMQL